MGDRNSDEVLQLWERTQSIYKT